jgi:hypothetical protein
MGFAPIPAVTEPPKSLGPPTVVLVYRTLDNPAGAPDHLTSSVSVFFTLPKSVSPITQIFNTTEVRVCGSSYNNFKSRRFETGGSLGRRVKCRRVPQPRWVGARPSAKGGEKWSKSGVREVEIPRPSCSSRAQVGCACSRGLQASTRERERAASHERLSRPRPRAAKPSLRGPWSFLL